MKKTKINPMSRKAVQQKRDELPEREKLIAQCGGRPEYYTRMVRFNDGTTESYTAVKCIGGICQICNLPGTPFDPLFPHEKVHRSQGGKVTAENSVMCHNRCQAKEHGEPQLRWIGETA